MVPASTKDDLLAEVANLVEAPTPVRGSFEPRFLQLPRSEQLQVIGMDFMYVIQLYCMHLDDIH